MARDRDIEEIRTRLNNNALSLAEKLIPDSYAEKSGGMYKPRNPTCYDKRPGSFVIWTEGEGAGAWKEYSPKNGLAAGDVFDLIAYVKGWHMPADFPKVLDWARGFLGISQKPVEGAKRRTDPPPADYVAGSSGSGSVATLTPDKAKGQWLAGGVKAEKDRADLLDTPIMTYLARRGIDLYHILSEAHYSYPLGPLRFHPRGRYYRRYPDYTEHPVMCTAFTRGSLITGLHRTYLTEGGDKADVPKAKKMRGDVKGAAIKLWRGHTGKRLSDLVKRGETDTLCLVEGIEDALCVIQAVPEWRVWPVGSFGNFVDVGWPVGISKLYLIGDNDGAASEAAWQNLIRAFMTKGAGREFIPFRPPMGKDINDWLQSLKADA